MLDGVDAGVQGILDSWVPWACVAVLRSALCASSIAAFISSIVSCALPGSSTRGHYAAGRHDLDQIHAVLQQLAGMFAGVRSYPVGFPVRFSSHGRRSS